MWPAATPPSGSATGTYTSSSPKTRPAGRRPCPWWTADGLVIAVNGQVADGEDLSWLWDVRFEDFGELAVKASGERGTDLAVRLTYAEIQHELVHNMMDAILACPEGRVEVLANYTAFRDLKRALVRRIEAETH